MEPSLFLKDHRCLCRLCIEYVKMQRKGTKLAMAFATVEE